jgi:tRNA G26 N,N-dimethylase Trm1
MIRPGSTKATNNDARYFDFKVKIRKDALYNSENKKVLLTHAGNNDLWRKIYGYESIYKIDADPRFNVDHVGDSLKFIKHNDIQQYGIIDIDTWGSPSKYLEAIFDKKYKGVIVCTFCSPILMNPDKILCLNYYGEIYNNTKRKSKLNIGNDKLIISYLHAKGVPKINGFLSNKKCYFWFKT